MSDIKAIIAELKACADTDGDIVTDALTEAFEVIDEGGWESEYKYDYCQYIVKHISSGLFFAIVRHRLGSYYSDYHYDPSSVHQVKPVKVVRTVWELCSYE